MTRRRSRSLAASPAQHAKRVDILANKALHLYASAFASAETGDCLRAFDDYRTAVELDGKAGENFIFAPPAFRAEHPLERVVTAAHEKAHRKMRQACIVSGGSKAASLHGMRRRSRR